MAKLRIALVSPPSSCVEDDRLEPPLGLLYLAAHLRARGYEDVAVLDLTGNDGVQAQRRIESLPVADIYGVTTFCTNHQQTKLVIQQARRVNRDACIVIGGPNPTGLPQFTLTDSGADVVVAGEGEDAFADCVESVERGRRPAGIVVGQPRPDVDSYVFPARDLVDYSSYSRTFMGRPVVSLLGSRGCKHHCMHCNSVVMGGGARQVRFRSATNIAAEIRALRDRFDCLRFNDDHFTGHPHFSEVLAAIGTLDVQFRIFARVEDLTDSCCRQLRAAGCTFVSIGLESLNPQNLLALGRSSQTGQEAHVRIARAHGLAVRASFMVGLPFDTDSNIEKYFHQAANLGLDEYALYPLIPYPGTLLWDHPERFGYTIINRDFTRYVQMGRNGQTCFALKHRDFGPDDVARWRQRACELLEAGGVRHMCDSQIAR